MEQKNLMLFAFGVVLIGVFIGILAFLRPGSSPASINTSQSSSVISMPSKIKLIPQMQIGFWTPSPDFIADNGLIIRKGTFGSYQTTQEQRGNEWQNITPQKIDTFSTQLFLKYEVRGRRYEHYGLGEDSRKPGYWWVLSVDQKFDLESFAKWYVEFFQATKLDRKTDTKVPYKLYIEKYNIENGRIEPSL